MRRLLTSGIFAIWLITNSFAVFGQGCIDSTLIDPGVVCTTIYEPICSCEDITYTNSCQAVYRYGVTAWTPGECSSDADTCAADFIFMYQTDGSIYFRNISLPFQTHTWQLPGENISGDTARTLFYTPTLDDPFEVCLSIVTEAGCTSTFCQWVYPDAPGDLCHQSDCVWPGDANHNWMANHYDLLHIGLGFGVSGQPRPYFPYPGNPMVWAPNFGYDWIGFIDDVNYKHLDCNGDGQINEEDIEAIMLNYMPDLSFTSFPTPGAPPIYLEFEEDTIVIDDTTPEFVEVTADLIIADEVHPVFDFYGFALSFQYPDALVAAHDVSVDYNDNSFFGPINTTITVQKELSPEHSGRFDLAFSRTTGQGVSGFGVVATLKFIINADIIDGRSEATTPFPVPLRGIKLIDKDNNVLAYDLPIADTLFFINTRVTDTEDVPEAAQVRIFPNPTQQSVFLDFGPNLSVQTVEVFQQDGKRIRTVANHQRSTLQLQLPVAGVYFIRIRTTKGVINRRILVQ